MSENPSTTTETELDKNQGIFTRTFSYLNKYQSNLKTKWGVFYLIVAAVIGFFGAVGYDYLKSMILPTDQYLVSIRDEQSKQYEDLKNGLSALKGSIDSSESRSAFEEVNKTSAEMIKTNKNLTSQLELSKQENDKLSKLAQKASGISGGYDFILNEGSSMRIDSSTIIGVERISKLGLATVNITAASVVNERYKVGLKAGESIAYTNAQGKSCKVTALSISTDSVSFGNNCS